MKITSKELIEQIKKADPSGEMIVFIAVDSGEGYCLASQIFVDDINKQSIDGDDYMTKSRITKEYGLFIGDSNAAQSKKVVWEFILNNESIKNYDKDYEDPVLTIKYEQIHNVEEKLGIVTTIPNNTDVHLYLSHDEQEILVSVQCDHSKCIPKIIDTKLFLQELCIYINSIEMWTGLDHYDRVATLKKLY